MERFDVIQAGFTGDAVLARAGLVHNEALIRASALRALHRMGHLTSDDLNACISDADADVRRERSRPDGSVGELQPDGACPGGTCPDGTCSRACNCPMTRNWHS